jgi:hypothetical protein
MSEKTINLGFINQDVNAQLERSQDMVQIAQSLTALLPKIEDPDVKSKLEESIRTLLTTANSLTTNASSTSANAALTIVSSRSR